MSGNIISSIFHVLLKVIIWLEKDRMLSIYKDKSLISSNYLKEFVRNPRSQDPAF
jgi:hypothetical protein